MLQETIWDDALEAVEQAVAMPAEDRAGKRERKYLVELALLKLDGAALAERRRADEEAASKKEWLKKKVAEAKMKARAATK